MWSGPCFLLGKGDGRGRRREGGSHASQPADIIYSRESSSPDTVLPSYANTLCFSLNLFRHPRSSASRTSTTLFSDVPFCYYWGNQGKRVKLQYTFKDKQYNLSLTFPGESTRSLETQIVFINFLTNYVHLPADILQPGLCGPEFQCFFYPPF